MTPQQPDIRWIDANIQLPLAGTTILVFDAVSGGPSKCDVGPDGALLFDKRPNLLTLWTHWQPFSPPVLTDSVRQDAKILRAELSPPYRVALRPGSGQFNPAPFLDDEI